jgi:uncharacterized protein YukE
MSIISLVEGAVMGGLSSVASGASRAGDVQSVIQGSVKQVTSSWIGGDEKSFEQEVNSKLLPAIADFIAALSGLGTVTQKAMDILHQADSSAKGMVDKLLDEYNQI